MRTATCTATVLRLRLRRYGYGCRGFGLDDAILTSTKVFNIKTVWAAIGKNNTTTQGMDHTALFSLTPPMPHMYVLVR